MEEVERESVLSVLFERMNELGHDPETMGRMTYVCRVADASKVRAEDMKEVHEKCISECGGTDTLTGLLLFQPQSCVHICEGPSRTLLLLLQALSDHARSHFSTIRVLNFVDDVGGRQFAAWISKELTYPRVGEVPPSQPPPYDRVHVLYANLLQIGKRLGQQKTKIYVFVETLKQSCLQFLPTNEEVLDLAAEADLFDVEEFLKVYWNKHEVVLQGEIVWPIEPKVKYLDK